MDETATKPRTEREVLEDAAKFLNLDSIQKHYLQATFDVIGHIRSQEVHQAFANEIGEMRKRGLWPF